MYDSKKEDPVKIERSGDLVHLTYHMVDWSKTKQTPSEHKCVQCGRQMKSVEPVEDERGRLYDGLVCHNCRRVLWVRQD